MRILLIGALAIIYLHLCGCYTPGKARRQVMKAYVKQKPTLDELVSLLYNPIDSVSDKTIHIPDAKPIVKRDTVKKDSLIYIYETIKVTDTVFKEKTIKTEDKARIQLLESVIKEERAKHADEMGKAYQQFDKLKSQHNKELTKAKEQKASAETKAKGYFWWAIIATALVVGGAALKYFKII